MISSNPSKSAPDTVVWSTLPLLLTRKQVLMLTGWGKYYFYKVIAAGQLRQVRPGGTTHGRVLRAELQRLIS